MNTFLFAIYILMWPALSAGALLVIVFAFGRDLRRAKREGKSNNIV